MKEKTMKSYFSRLENGVWTSTSTYVQAKIYLKNLWTNYYLYFFLMNNLLQIKFEDDLYCFCNLLNQETCQICTVVIEFVGFEDESTKNMMNIDF